MSAPFYLHELDLAFGKSDLFYVRFMDDILILAPTRWKIRRAMAMVQSILTELRLRVHPGKAFIGRVCRGFYFLGYHFLNGVLSAAETTVAKMTEIAAQLYEQKGHSKEPTPLGQYLTRWTAWVRDGLGDLDLRLPFLAHLQPSKTREAG